MTTYFPYVIPLRTTFNFQPTLDGQVYSAIVTWNVFGRRNYLNLYDLSGVRIVTTAVVGSPDGLQLQSLTWRAGKVTAITDLPHGYKIGDTVTLTVSGCAPDGYNGQVEAFIVGPSIFTYWLATDPGALTAPGYATQNISLVGGLFASTLVFRTSTNNFEASP